MLHDLDNLARQADPLWGQPVPQLPAALAEDIIQGRSRARPRIARRLVVLAAAATIAILGTAGAVRIFSDPEQMAANTIGCYEDAEFKGGMTVIWPDGSDPVKACADEYRRQGRKAPAMIACGSGGGVAVVPGRDPQVCAGIGMEPLPVEYAAERERVAMLERDIMALERQGCLPPEEFERRVQALLVESGWTGWTTWLRLDLGEGACGTVSNRGGDDRRSLSGAIDPDSHRIMVFAEPPREAQAKVSTLTPLYDQTGARCWSLAELQARIRRQAGGLGLTVAFAVFDEPGSILTHPDGTREHVTDGQLADARDQRWRDGCAILTDIALAGDGRAITVELVQKGAQAK